MWRKISGLPGVLRTLVWENELSCSTFRSFMQGPKSEVVLELFMKEKWAGALCQNAITSKEKLLGTHWHSQGRLTSFRTSSHHTSPFAGCSAYKVMPNSLLNKMFRPSMQAPREKNGQYKLGSILYLGEEREVNSVSSIYFQRVYSVNCSSILKTRVAKNNSQEGTVGSL